MSQHFLLSAAARTLSLAKVMRMSEDAGSPGQPRVEGLLAAVRVTHNFVDNRNMRRSVALRTTICR
jgi:hypothetical protein